MTITKYALPTCATGVKDIIRSSLSFSLTGTSTLSAHTPDGFSAKEDYEKNSNSHQTDSGHQRPCLSQQFAHISTLDYPIIKIRVGHPNTSTPLRGNVRCGIRSTTSQTKTTTSLRESHAPNPSMHQSGLTVRPTPTRKNGCAPQVNEATSFNSEQKRGSMVLSAMFPSIFRSEVNSHGSPSAQGVL